MLNYHRESQGNVCGFICFNVLDRLTTISQQQMNFQQWKRKPPKKTKETRSNAKQFVCKFGVSSHHYQIKYGAFMSMSIPLFSGFQLDGLWPTSILIFLIQVSRHDTAHWSLAGGSYINKPCLISSFYLTSIFLWQRFLLDFRFSDVKPEMVADETFTLFMAKSNPHLFCLVVWNSFYFSIGNVIIRTELTKSIIFQRGMLKPPTSFCYFLTINHR